MFTDDAERTLKSFSPIRPSFLLCRTNSRHFSIFREIWFAHCLFARSSVCASMSRLPTRLILDLPRN